MYFCKAYYYLIQYPPPCSRSIQIQPHLGVLFWSLHLILTFFSELQILL